MSLDLSKLSPHEKRRLLEKLLRERAEFHPLSYAQRSMWFLHQLAPNAAAYNAGFAARVASEVDIEALETAFQWLVNRHAALRTTFVARDGKLRQWIHTDASFRLQRVDATAWDEQVLRQRVQESCAQPFDLEAGPLLRVMLFTHGSNDHVLLLVVHHIVFDGWSFWVLLDELRVCYESARQNVAPQLPPLQATYPDFVTWEAKMVGSGEGEAHLAYWKEQLAGNLPLLELPADRCRPDDQVFEGDAIVVPIRREVSQRIKDLARFEGVTPFTVLLAAYQAFLFRYSGQNDILVGFPTSGRNRPEFSGVVGDFVNMVVLRSRPTPDISFREFLQAVNRTVLEALEHQEYPFPLLVEKLNPGWSRNYSPLFQASFVFHRSQRSDRLLASLDSDDPVSGDWNGLALSSYPLSQQAGQFDLTFEVADSGDQFKAMLKYSTSLFDAPTVERMGADLKSLLEDVAVDPSCQLAELLMPNAPGELEGASPRDMFLL